MVHGKWVNGNLVFYDTNRKRILDAWGPNVIKWELPRVNCPLDDTTVNPTGTVTTETSACTCAAGITQGVALTLTTAGAEYAGFNMQWLGTPFALAANKPTYFGAKIAMSHATSTDFFVGLNKTDTTITKASGSHIMTTADTVGFYKLDAGTTTYATTSKASTGSQTNTSSAMTTSAKIYEWYFDGNSSMSSATIGYYINGSLVATHSTVGGIPTAVMQPSLSFRAGAASSKVMSIHWMRCIQLST